MSSSVLDSIGRKLREARDKCALTQEQVAKHIGINRNELSYYETGKREISITLLDKLANIYGYSSKYFLDDSITEEPEIQIAFRADEINDEDLATISWAKTFLKNLFELSALKGR